MFEFLFIAGIFSLFLVFYEVFEDKKNSEDKYLNLFRAHFRRYMRVPIAYFLMVSFGTLVGLIQLIPTLAYLPLSIRIEQFSHWEAVQGGLHFYDVVGILLPYLNYPFSVFPTASHLSGYLGIIPIFLFLIAFSLKRKKSLLKQHKNKIFILFFSYLFLFGLFLSINSSPVFWLIHHLPIINLLQAASRWMLVSFFSFAVLVGFGLDILLDKFDDVKKSFRIKALMKIFKYSIFLLSLVSVFMTTLFYFFKDKVLLVLNIYFDNLIYPNTSKLAKEFYYDYISRLFTDLVRTFDILNPRFLLPFLFLVISYVFLRYSFSRKNKPKELLSMLVFITVLNFVIVLFPLVLDFSGKESVLNKEPETVKFLKTQEEGRAFSFFRYTSLNALAQNKNTLEKSILKSALLFPNKNVFFRIEGVDFEGDPMANKSMSRFITYIGGAASLPQMQKLENIDANFETKIKIFESRKPVMDFLNIKYLLSSSSIDEDIFPKIFETEVTSKKAPVFVYKNKDARSLYYFTNEEWLKEFKIGITTEDLGEDFRKDVVLSERQKESIYLDTKLEEFNKKLRESDGIITKEGIKLIQRKNNLLVLETDAKGSKLLVFSQNNLPGWKAYIDNEEVDIHDIATIYMGVSVPEGKHNVSFKYSYWEIWKYFFENIFEFSVVVSNKI